MEEVILQLSKEIINDYQQNSRYLLNSLVSTISEITQTYHKKQAHFQENFIATTNDLVWNIQKIHSKSVIKNKDTSCDFNMLSLFHIGETQHSYLLAYFLNPNAEHGQKHLFLNVFLDLLKIERFNDNENWIVTAEKGRIDVLLKRVQPHSVVVIENKSNYANDQNHQLYRYWHQEIYKTIFERHLPKDYILNPPERYYQLLYLSPQHWKIPSTNTLTKPTEWDSNLPKKVPLNTKALLFSDFVCKWLKISLKLLPKDNHRIREYVKQYIEYWN
jgi:hypothetical protein